MQESFEIEQKSSPQPAKTATFPPPGAPNTTTSAAPWDPTKVMISMVNSASETETMTISIVEVLENIQSGTWRDQVEHIGRAYQQALKSVEDPLFREEFLAEQLFLAQERGIKGEKARALAEQNLENYPKKKIAPLKKGLPAAMFSGKFLHRRADAIEEPSGIICADLDKLGKKLEDIREKLKKDPYVFSVFVSPSGDGLKVLVRIPPEVDLFKRAFTTVQVHFRKQYGVEIDEACSDISRLCFVSFDPLLWRNDSAVPISLLPEEELKMVERPRSETKLKTAKPTKKTTESNAGEKDEISKAESKKLFDLDKEIVRCFLDDHPDDHDAAKVVSALEFIDPSHEKVWRDVMMALKAQWGDYAWELGDEWSAQGSGYDERKNGDRWDSFDDEPKSGFSLGTIFFYAKENGWRFHEKKGVILPTRSNSAFCREVYRIAAPTNTLFLQGGETVCIESIDDQPQIVAVDTMKGIRLFEQLIQFLKKEEKNEDGECVVRYVPVPLSEHHSKLLVKGVRPGELSELKGITCCPPLIPTADGTNLQPAGQGYIPETGWFNVSEFDVPHVPLKKAINSLIWLYKEFDFPTVGDRSRALVYPIGIALKLSGLIHGFVPLDFGSANAQQSGKGTRQRMTAAFFGYRMEVITQSESHIGGTAESFKAACLAGKTFIQLDNFDHYSCREMEAFLTGERVRMRAAFGRSRSVDPCNFFICISSNGLAARRDLAERTWFIRILKKPDGFQFYPYQEGGIIEHILKHHHYYLGCIYSIIREWWRRGKPHTDETRHSFREFTQVCDWIAQNILGEVGVMDGHTEAAGLYGDAGRVFFSRIWDTAEKQGKLNRLFKATQLAMMAFRFSIPVPGAVGRARQDEEAAAKLIGAVAADLFSDADSLDLGQGRLVQRLRGRPPGEDRSDWDDDERPHLPRGKNAFCYNFKQQMVGNHETLGKNGSHQQIVQTDWLVQFRDDVLAAMEETKRTPPCRASTSEIAAFFQGGSVDSVGKWMASLSQRWPEQFSGIRTENYRGWEIKKVDARE